ncbi:hypothetical protein P7K49_015815 [Saguinus oedipus]|uniref:Uncharacterized protein n=1 Tax=Saguinus oedipus TaxID=9490 RepID=A0ABQ9VAB1_SAGOE|nr:hypothetical protein P7K49_015815 [Saguinus oedipus]
MGDVSEGSRPGSEDEEASLCPRGGSLKRDKLEAKEFGVQAAPQRRTSRLAPPAVRSQPWADGEGLWNPEWEARPPA